MFVCLFVCSFVRLSVRSFVRSFVSLFVSLFCFVCLLVTGIQVDRHTDRQREHIYTTYFSIHMLIHDRYRFATVWESKSIAYHARTMTEIKPLTCGAIKRGLFSGVPFIMLKCNTNMSGYILCEFDTKPNLTKETTAGHLLGMDFNGTHHTAKQSNVSRLFVKKNLITCPVKHVTFSFLACDVSSQCYAENGVIYLSDSQAYHLPTPSSCLAPLTPLSPALPCENGGQRVPYTLVCDHRDDCGDGSDEDFCVFPPCRGNTPLKCGSSQEVCTVKYSVELKEGLQEGLLICQPACQPACISVSLTACPSFRLSFRNCVVVASLLGVWFYRAGERADCFDVSIL